MRNSNRVQSAWDELSLNSMPDAYTAAARSDLKNSFFAGAQIMKHLLVEIMTAGLGEDELTVILNELDQEFVDHFGAIDTVEHSEHLNHLDQSQQTQSGSDGLPPARTD